MIEKLSPTLELALQNELRQAYLKGVETGRKMEREQFENKPKGYRHNIPHANGKEDIWELVEKVNIIQE